MLKYRNRKTTTDNIIFHSQKEARQYLVFKAMLKSGAIKQLELQPVFKFPCNIKYIADFRVTWKNGRVEIFDVKGFFTQGYKNKKKMMKNCLGIEITEV